MVHYSGDPIGAAREILSQQARADHGRYGDLHNPFGSIPEYRKPV